MGGRGSESMGGGYERDSGGSLSNLGGAPDKRADIQKSFVDELGFSQVLGTNNIPTATLNSYAIALKKLERKYGAIAASENPSFVTGNGDGSGTLAAVYSNPNNPAQQFMAINSNVLGSTHRNLASQASSEASGWAAGTDGKITNRNAYTVVHEYGHMLHNAMAAHSGLSSKGFTQKAKNEIMKIAKSKYNATGNVSTYGTTNSREFFAEAFASYNSGKPNAYGKAMGDWLEKNKLK